MQDSTTWRAAGIDRCLFLLADGARPDVLADLFSRGELPNLQQHLRQRGTFVPATTVFPSTTGPAFLPYLTGCYPGTLNVPGIRWLRRGRDPVGPLFWRKVRSYVGPESYLLNGDIPRRVPTLFEIAGSSANVMSLVNRGSGPLGNKTKIIRALCWLYGHYTGHWRPVDALAAAICRRAIREGRRFIFTLFPAIDEYAHLHDPFAPPTLRAYRQLDRLVGEIAAELQRCGAYERTALFLFSDHGLSATATHFELWRAPERFGLPTLYHPRVFRRGVKAACMISGNGMGHLYFATADGHMERILYRAEIERRFHGLCDYLLEQPAVDLLAAREEEGWLWVRTRKGEAHLAETAAGIEYRPWRGDPLELGAAAAVFHPRQALQRTMNTSYPDSLVQLLQLFRAPRCGDLVVSAAPDYDLRDRHEHPEHFSSHGSLRREHMLVPLLCSLPLDESRPWRSADVFCLGVSALGLPLPGGIDGAL